jgi:hypothetical protein
MNASGQRVYPVGTGELFFRNFGPLFLMELANPSVRGYPVVGFFNSRVPQHAMEVLRVCNQAKVIAFPAV